jgi:hypothetical protein
MKKLHRLTPLTMAGLDPATQQASVSERNGPVMFHAETRSARSSFSFPRPSRLRVNPFAPADAVALGGRVKPGHGEFCLQEARP